MYIYTVIVNLRAIASLWKSYCDRPYPKSSGKQIMTYCTDLDQEQRLEQYAAIEEIYISGMGDAMAGIFPQMAELIYLQGFAEGMRQFRMQVRLAPQPVVTEIEEFPLLCGQCEHLNNSICEIKSIPKNSNSYACDRVVINCPF